MGTISLCFFLFIKFGLAQGVVLYLGKSSCTPWGQYRQRWHTVFDIYNFGILIEFSYFPQTYIVEHFQMASSLNPLTAKGHLNINVSTWVHVNRN